MQKPRSEKHYLSPDSVLDAVTSLRFPCRKRSSPWTDLDAVRKMTRMRNKMEKLDDGIMMFTGDLSNLTLADINNPEQQLEFSVTKIRARKAKFRTINLIMAQMLLIN
uniref:K-box domain-containing protein n=1 Tax=Oryza brachyantha TaxID=4533 RepID=J3ND18_ORYBR